jgi:cystathionine beta-lyase/cystathionine gamma-synthase
MGVMRRLDDYERALARLEAAGGGIVASGLAAITTVLLGLLCVAESRAEL